MDTLKFPIFPVDGETFSYNNRIYTFNQSESTWYASNVELPFDPALVQIMHYGSGIAIVTNKVDLNNDILWAQIRHVRDIKLSELDWRYNRYHRLERLGLDQIDDLNKLDEYSQALADITKQPDPSNIVWPSI